MPDEVFGIKAEAEGVWMQIFVGKKLGAGGDEGKSVNVNDAHLVDCFDHGATAVGKAAHCTRLWFVAPDGRDGKYFFVAAAKGVFDKRKMSFCVVENIFG